METLTPKEQEVILTTGDLVNRQINRMSELELKTMILKITAGLETSIEGTRVYIPIDKEELKSIQGNMKNTFSELQSKSWLHKLDE